MFIWTIQFCIISRFGVHNFLLRVYGRDSLHKTHSEGGEKIDVAEITKPDVEILDDTKDKEN